MKPERPFKKEPDFEHLRKTIMRETTTGPVPTIEVAIDPEIMSTATGVEFPADRFKELIEIGSVSNASQETLKLGIRYMDFSLAFYKAIGYDYVSAITIMPLPRPNVHLKKENPQQPGKVRAWREEHKSLITSRSELEAISWPRVEEISLFSIDYMAERISPDMKVMAYYSGIFEELNKLMGFETMAIKSIEEPALLGNILEQLTILAEAAVDMAAAHPAVGAVFYADDMGFNSGTMLSPKFMREWIIPRQKRIADTCHKHNKPFLLHSCGQIDALMEDLIEIVGIDARHGFQDNIEPVEEIYKKYGDRIAILGGVDVDLLARGTPDAVRVRTRQLLQSCAFKGGFCIGSNNSVTNFCKIENYYAMLDETRKWNEEH